MSTSYFVGEGPEAKVLIDETNAKIRSFFDAVQALAAEFPNSNGGIHKGERGPLIGICIDGAHKLSPEEAKRLGVNPFPEMLEESYFYKPDKRTKAGKEMHRRMDAINKTHVKFSDQIIDALKLYRMVADASRGVLRFSTVGSKDNKIFVLIPGTPDDNEHRSFPKVPDWFRKPEGDEYQMFLR